MGRERLHDALLGGAFCAARVFELVADSDTFPSPDELGKKCVERMMKEECDTMAVALVERDAANAGTCFSIIFETLVEIADTKE